MNDDILFTVRVMQFILLFLIGYAVGKSRRPHEP